MASLKTEELIRVLVSEIRPVRPLRSPAFRAARWVAIAIIWTAAVASLMGPRPDLRARLADWRWLTGQAAVLATALMAAHAALAAGIPGRGRRWERFAPLVFLPLWLASVGTRSSMDGWASLSAQHAFPYLAGIVLMGSVPAFAIVRMVLRGVPLAPIATTALGVLATAAAAEAGLQLTHPIDFSSTAHLWQGSALIGLIILGASLVSYWASRRSRVP